MDTRRVLDHYPLPIARCYRRFLNASQPRERHDHAYFLFEVYLKYAASIAIASYLAGEERDHRVNAALKGLARPSMGEWLRFLRECLAFLAERKAGDAAILAMAELFGARDARWTRVVDLYNALCTFRAGSESRKKQVSLEMLLGELVAYRNRVLGHGAPLEDAHYGELGGLLAGAFVEVLEASPYLTARRLVVFDSMQVHQGSRVECGVLEFMGDNPIRRQTPRVIPYGDPVPPQKVLCLLAEEGGFISLDPLLVAHDEDVYFLNEAQGAPEYLSYATGQRYRPSAMGAAQGDLFERILGYRVDQTRLSRIGEDLAPPEKPPAEGERRLGDFRILREIGRGGMGTVFEAVQESLGRRVALKVLPGTFALDPRRVERFHREARATARIHHPNIVPVYEVGEAEGTHFYAMEYIDGTSLDQLLAKAREESGAKPGRQGSSTGDPAYIAHAVEQIAAVAEGLEEAHRLGLIHRDVKPSNILVEKYSPRASRPEEMAGGRYVLVDFGLVHETEAQTLTRSGELVGTLSYMPPEQVSRSAIDARADVYTLGATLYEVLTLRAPFEKKSEHELQKAILFEEPIPPRRLNPRLNRDLETILLHALEKNPERRYPSAGELAADLRRLLRYEPIRARPLSPLTRLARRAWRHRGKLAAAAAISLLLAATAVLLLKASHQDRLRRAADYEPRVLREVMKMQLGRLAMKAGMAETQTVDPGGLLARQDLEVLEPEAGADPVADAVAGLREAAEAVPDRPDAYYHRSRGLQLLGREEEALEDLARATACDPDFAPAAILRAAILQKRGDLEGARAERERAGRLGESGWGEIWLAAHQARSARRWKEAAEAYGKLIDLEAAGRPPYLGSSAETRLGRGVARLEARDFPGALVDFAAAQAFWQQAVEPVLLLGKTYFLMGSPPKAEETFDDLHRKARFPDEAALGVASLYGSLGQYDEALDWVERVRVDSIRERNRIFFLGSLGRWGEALEAGEEACRLNPRDARAHAYLAYALQVTGRTTESAERLRAAIDIDPQNALAHTLLASIREIQGDPQEALGLYRKAVELDPGNPWAYNSLGVLLLKLGEPGQALELLQKAVEIDPRLLPAHYNLHAALDATGRLEESMESYQKAMQDDPADSLPHLLLALALRRQGKLEEARMANVKAVELEPSAITYNMLGVAFLVESRPRDADDAFLKARDLDPSGSRVHANLAIARYREGKLEESIESYRKALEIRPDLAGIHKRLGDALKSLGRTEESIDAYCASLKMDPKGLSLEAPPHPNIWSYIRLKEKPAGFSRRLDEVLAKMEDALSWGGEDRGRLHTTLALGWIHHPERKDPEKAVHYARQGLEEDKAKSMQSFLVLAEVQAEAGDLAGAVLTLEEGMRLPHATRELERQARRLRTALLPRVPSYASADAVLAASDRRLLIPAGAAWRYFMGKEEPSPGTEWTGSDFADEGWASGRSGFGYGDADDETVLEEMRGKWTTLYIRHAFPVADPSSVLRLVLSVRVDDGFVAYLNAVEVGRKRGGREGTRMPFHATSTLSTTDAVESEVDVDPKLLRQGRNVVAIQGLNSGRGSSDFSLIPVLEAEGAPDPAKDRSLLEELLPGTREPARAGLAAYVEGRVLERAGRHAEAAERFAESAARDRRQPEPRLALARSLRAAGDFAGGARTLEEALRGGLSGEKKIWMLWLEVSFLDLERSPSDLVAGFPLPGATGPGADAFWLLERLVEGKPIRINCGGPELPAADGAWAADRFAAGGTAVAGSSGVKATGPEDALHRTYRSFPEDGLHPAAYRIPLPRGRYRITLHFAETELRRPADRVFDVRLEGAEALGGYEVLVKAGFAVPVRETFPTIAVEDGALDIDLVPRVGASIVSGLEISPVLEDGAGRAPSPAASSQESLSGKQSLAR